MWAFALAVDGPGGAVPAGDGRGGGRRPSMTSDANEYHDRSIREDTHTRGVNVLTCVVSDGGLPSHRKK